MPEYYVCQSILNFQGTHRIPSQQINTDSYTMVLNKVSNLVPIESSPLSHTMEWNGATDQEPHMEKTREYISHIFLQNVSLKIIIHREITFKHAHCLLCFFPLQCSHCIKLKRCAKTQYVLLAARRIFHIQPMCALAPV